MPVTALTNVKAYRR